MPSLAPVRSGQTGPDPVESLAQRFVLEFLDHEIVDEPMHQMRTRGVIFRLGETVERLEVTGGPAKKAALLLESGSGSLQLPDARRVLQGGRARRGQQARPLSRAPHGTEAGTQPPPSSTASQVATTSKGPVLAIAIAPQRQIRSSHDPIPLHG